MLTRSWWGRETPEERGHARRRYYTATGLGAGKGTFGMDARVPGMVYASIERPPVLGGKVKSVDDAEAEPSYDAAEGRGQKYSSLVNGCAISNDPTSFPSGPVTMLPLAVNGNKVCPIAQMVNG